MKIYSVEKIASYLGHTDAVFCLHFDPSSRFLFSGSADGLVAIWQPGKSENGLSVVRVNAPIWSMLKIQNTLYVGTSKGNIHEINLTLKKEMRNIQAHSGGVFQIIPSENGLLSGGADGILHAWDTKLNLLYSKKISEKSIRTIEVFPDNSGLLIACSDNNIYKTNYLGEILNVWKGHSLSVFSVCFHQTNSHTFVSAGRDAVLRVWNESSEIQKIDAHLYAIHSLSLSPCGTFVASSSMDKTIKIWDAKTFKLLKVIDNSKVEAHSNCVNKVLWIANDEIISCSDDKQILHFKLHYTHDTQ